MTGSDRSAVKARLVTIDQVNQTGQRVLFDANILIDAFKQPTGPVNARMARLKANQRYTIDFVLWEFLLPGTFRREEIKQRVRWLSDRQIRRFDAWTASCRDSFRTLLNQVDRRGSLIDGALAACSLASQGQMVIATNDADDFAPLKNVTLLDEFLQ
jgi:predicted nucleic acid-binding protein